MKKSMNKNEMMKEKNYYRDILEQKLKNSLYVVFFQWKIHTRKYYNIHSVFFSILQQSFLYFQTLK